MSCGVVTITLPLISVCVCFSPGHSLFLFVAGERFYPFLRFLDLPFHHHAPIMADRYIAMHGLNISHSPLSTSPTMSIDKLFPALLECFGIIMFGYVAGRTDIISPAQAKGIGNFVSRFALPALLFKNMVLLDFGDVIWSFLWSVLIAKVTVFVIVCSLTLMVAGPESRYSKAGLYSIFATQSNDFALGYPIGEF